MPVAVKVSIKWLKSLWTIHPETPIHNIYQAKRPAAVGQSTFQYAAA